SWWWRPDASYEQLRHATVHARAEAFPLGFAMLTRRGVTGWRCVLTDVMDNQPRTRMAGSPVPTSAIVPVAGLLSWWTCWPRSLAHATIPTAVLLSVTEIRCITAPFVGKQTLPVFSDITASKVTAAHLAKPALLVVCQSTPKQVIHQTE